MPPKKGSDSWYGSIAGYNEANDKLLHEVFRTLLFDRLETSATITVLRPSDKILKEIIAMAPKGKPDYKDAAFGKARQAFLRYVLHGIVGGKVPHKDNIFDTFVGTAYHIYGDKGTYAIHTEAKSGADAMKGGVKAKSVGELMLNNAVVLILDGELPEGKPSTHQPTTGEVGHGKGSPFDYIMATRFRRPMSRGKSLSAVHAFPTFDNELKAMRGGAHLFTGGAAVGGKAVNRRELFDSIRSMFGDRSMQYIVGSLSNYLKEHDQPTYKAVMALATGAPFYDAVMMVEPLADSEKFGAAHRVADYLVSDRLLNDWAKNVDTNDADAGWIDFIEAINENAGVKKPFAEARREFAASVRHSVRKMRQDASFSALNLSVAEKLQKAYNDIAKNNKFNGSQVFDEEVYDTLADKFGKQFPAYLEWRDTTFAHYDQLADKMDDDSMLDHMEMATPGHNFISEMARLHATDDSVAESVTVSLAKEGYLPYLRCDCDDFQHAPDGQPTPEFETRYRSIHLGAMYGGAEPEIQEAGPAVPPEAPKEPKDEPKESKKEEPKKPETIVVPKEVQDRLDAILA
jgi:hypothetical protein